MITIPRGVVRRGAFRLARSVYKRVPGEFRALTEAAPGGIRHKLMQRGFLRRVNLAMGRNPPVRRLRWGRIAATLGLSSAVGGGIWTRRRRVH